MDCRVARTVLAPGVAWPGIKPVELVATPKQPKSIPPRAAEARRLVLDMVREKVVITSHDVMGLLGVRQNSANARLRKLVASGYLICAAGAKGAPGCLGGIAAKYTPGEKA